MGYTDDLLDQIKDLTIALAASRKRCHDLVNDLCKAQWENMQLAKQVAELEAKDKANV